MLFNHSLITVPSNGLGARPQARVSVSQSAIGWLGVVPRLESPVSGFSLSKKLPLIMGKG